MNVKGNERAALYASGGAFLLSLLIGILSGNPAATVVMRAFVSALVFGALVFAALLILKKYVPDIEAMTWRGAERGEQDEGEAGGEERGRTVDYTVDGGLPQDLLGPEGGAAGALGFEISGGRADGAGSPARDTGPSGAGKPARVPAPQDQDLDQALPSLDSLFESDEEEGEKSPTETPHFEETRAERKRDGDYIRIRDVRIPNEPEVMAKAIKRLMKQDQ